MESFKLLCLNIRIWVLTSTTLDGHKDEVSWIWSPASLSGQNVVDNSEVFCGWMSQRGNVGTPRVNEHRESTRCIEPSNRCDSCISAGYITWIILLVVTLAGVRNRVPSRIAYVSTGNDANDRFLRYYFIAWTTCQISMRELHQRFYRFYR